MKLWLLTQSVNRGYDTHDSVVVAAKTEEEARNINPDFSERWGGTYSTWAPAPHLVDAELLGTAKPGTKAGVILASFNAG
jgi:hypothetical protein